MYMFGRFLLILIMLFPAGYGVYLLCRQREMATIEGRNEELKKINMGLKEVHERLSGSVKTKGELEAWEKRLMSAQANLSNEIAIAEQRVRDANKRTELEQSRLSTVEKAINTGEARRTKIEDDVTRVEKSREAVSLEVDSLRKVVESLSAQVSERKLLLGTLSNSVVEVEGKVENAKMRLAGINQEIELAVDKRMKELQDLQKRKIALGGELSRLESSVRSLTLQTNELHQAVVEEEELAAAARQRKLGAVQDADRATLEAKKFRMECQAAEKEVSEVNRRLGELRADCLIKKSDADRLGGEISSLGVTLAELQGYVSVTNALLQEITRLNEQKRSHGLSILEQTNATENVEGR